MKQGVIRIIMVLAIAGLLVASSMRAPAMLRGIDAFSVQHVEVRGTRYLSAEAAVAAAGITAASNIFDDPAPWIDALSRHPMVRRAEVERRIPGSLRLTIYETRPVAFARTPELRAIDEHGRILPADPAAEGMDLPVLLLQTRVSAAGRAADPATLRIVAFLGTVHRQEPGLLGWISEIGTHGDAVRLVLRSGADAEVLVPAQPTAERLRELHLTLADLASPRFAAADGGSAAAMESGEAMAGAADAGEASARNAAPELSRVKRIDGRYQDQVVVALHRGKN
jgi:hypothetical protein